MVWPLILQGTVVTVVAFVSKRKAGWTSSVYGLYGDGVLPRFPDTIPLPTQKSMLGLITLMSAVMTQEIRVVVKEDVESDFQNFSKGTCKMTTQAMALALLGLCYNEAVKGKEDIEAFIDKLRTRRGFREKTREE